jgi:hypothetical protein
MVDTRQRDSMGATATGTMMAFLRRTVSPVPARIAFVVVAAALAGGCANSVTYGTGKPTGMQTVSDLTGILSLGGSRGEEIDYEPRPGLVEPPTNNLPPPGEGRPLAENWPRDPDVTRAEIAEANRRAQATMSDAEFARRDPGFRVPVEPPQQRQQRQENVANVAGAEEFVAGNQRLAEARASRAGSYDAEGRPVRRFLTEPPAEYREPDPNAPMTIQEQEESRRGFSLRRVLGLQRQ